MPTSDSAKQLARELDALRKEVRSSSRGSQARFRSLEINGQSTTLPEIAQTGIDAKADAEVAKIDAEAARLAAAAATVAAQGAATKADDAEAAALEAAGIAASAGRIVYTTSEPEADEHTLWIPPPDNVPRRWDGTDWVPIPDAGIAAAAQAAADAEAAADAARELAQQAQNTASTASGTASTALTTAQGKNTVTYATTIPSKTTNPGIRVGDLWYQTNPTGGIVVGTWRWDGTDWKAAVFGDAVLGSLTVGKLTTGQISAGQKIIAGPSTGTHAEMSDTGFRAFRLDPSDNSVDEVVRIGTDTDDTIALIGANNKLLAGIDTTGVGTFTGLSVNSDPRFQGRLLSEVVGDRGRIVARTQDFANPGTTANEVGIVELACKTIPGHLYEVKATGLMPYHDGGGDNVPVRFYLRYTTDGSAPMVSSPVLQAANVISKFDLYPWEAEVGQLIGYYTEAVTSKTLRVGLSIAKGSTPNAVVGLNVDDTLTRRFFTITDLGLAPSDTGQSTRMGGTLSSGVAPPPPPSAPVVDGETLINSTWVSNFTGGGAYLDFAEAYQGYSPGYPANGNMRSFIGFPDIPVTVGSYRAIRYVKLYLYFGHWYRNDGGYPWIGLHANYSKVTTPTGQIERTMPNPPWVPRGGAIWVTLPSDWWGGFLNGEYRGIALGPGPNLDGAYYGRANGPGQPYQPQLAIGWQK